MGTLRTLLAISVLITHSEPIFGFRMLGGDMAINSFYMVSGFLMALVCETTYRGRVGTFYVNRVLRIYPPFFVALVISILLWTFVLTLHPHQPGRVIARLIEADNWLALLWVGLANLTNVTSELGRHLGVQRADFAGLAFFPSAGAGGAAGYAMLTNALFVPQAWTLGLELWFYLLVAPFLSRLHTWALLLLAAAGYWGDVYGVPMIRAQGVPVDPSGLFIFQFHFFLFGMLGYRLYAALAPLRWPRPLLGAVAALAVLPLLFFSLDLVRAGRLDVYVLFFTVAAALPFLFAWLGHRKWDKWIGELSYPIYLFHYAVVAVLIEIGGRGDVPWRGEAALVVTVVLSVAYIRLFDKRLQRFRRWVAARSANKPLVDTVRDLPRLNPATATQLAFQQRQAAE